MSDEIEESHEPEEIPNIEATPMEEIEKESLDVDMEVDESNGTPSYPSTPTPPPLLSPSDERTFAMLAHLSVLANLVTGFLGPVIALVFYLVYKDRSRYVAYHALQSMIFQLIWWVGGGALTAVAWTVSGALVAALFIGCLLMPIALLITFIPVAALVYGVIGAIQTSQGQDFKYWLIGDWVRGELGEL